MSSPVRVLELRSVWGTGGGPEKTILLGAAQADPAKYQVTVCYIRDARDDVFGIDGWAQGLGVEYVEVRERHSLDPAIWPALRRLVRERRIDIVHAHEYKTDLLALCLARAERVVPLATVHGWTGDSLRERAYYAVDKRLLARFPKLVAVSSDIRRELIRAGARPSRVLTLLNGIDPDAFQRPSPAVGREVRESLGLPPDALVVGAIGRLELQKRFDLLIEAFASVLKSYPSARLLIAGAGSRRAELEQAIASRGLGERCQLLGHRTDLARIHSALDLFVQSSEYEGTPNAVLEAMALGSPTVATAAGGTAELMEDGVHGWIVPCRDPERLARVMIEALSDPSARHTRAAAARARVEGPLSFGARMRALERIYDGLAARSPRRGGVRAAR